MKNICVKIFLRDRRSVWLKLRKTQNVKNSPRFILNPNFKMILNIYEIK